MSKQKRLAGFTLIEILVVVALIAILTAITFIAINPAKNFQDTRNTQRSADVTQILNAVTQYTSEMGNTLSDLGTVPVCPTTAAIISGTGTPTAGQVNLEGGPTGTGGGLVDTYIVGIPRDPNAPAGVDTGYTICTTSASGGRVQIAAPLDEGAKDGLIVVKR